MLPRDGIVPVIQRNRPADLLRVYDFTSGNVQGLSFGTSVAGAISRDSLEYVPANTQRRSHLGLLVERQATNKCTNTNLKPTDTSGTTPDGSWTVHERVARGDLPAAVLSALDSIDPQGNVTGVYRSRSNAAGVITVAGTVGNTNPHTPSVWHYTVTGDFGVGLSGSGPSAEPELNEWRRPEKPGTPAAGTETLVVGSSQASETYWFGNQLEEGDAQFNERTSLIEISGATATRLGDNVSAATPAINTASFLFTTAFNFYGVPADGNLARVTQLDNSADTSGTIFYTMIRHTSLTQQVRDDVGLILDTGVAYDVGTDTVLGAGMDGAGNAAVAVNGGNYISGIYTPQASYPRIRFGSRFDSTNQNNGYVQTVAVWDRPATQPNLEFYTSGSITGQGFSSGFSDGFG